MTPPIAERLLRAYARGFPVRRGKLRLVNALWRGAAGEAGTQRTANLAFGGYRMDCDLSEMLQRQFYFFGTYFLEEAILDHWSALATQASVVFDVGSNVGIYSLSALAANPKVKVEAFEPTPEIAAHLLHTASANHLDRLTVHEAAVSSAAGAATLVYCRPEDNGGMNFLGGSGAEGLKVQTVTLDGVCAARGYRRIELMKMDIQGHEHEALLGASDLLARGAIDHIFLELNFSGSEESHAAACVTLLKGHGYTFSAPGKQDFRPAGDWMRPLSDVVARGPNV